MTSGTGRLPLLRSAEMTVEQGRLYEQITGGPRSHAMGSLADSTGALRGPFNALLFAPAIGDLVQQLGAALRFTGCLPDRVRELLICLVAAELESSYEWHVHSRLAGRCGLDQEQLDKIWRRQPPGHLRPDEETAYALASAVLRRQPVCDDVFASAVEHFGYPGLVELLVLVGYYQLLGGVLDTCRIEAPGSEVRSDG